MADRKTRLQKAQAEARKLKRENNDLRIVNEALRTELVGMSKNAKKKDGSPTIKKRVLLYMYDIVVSALMLVFVYWIAINGYENFDSPYNFFIALVVFMSAKCLMGNKETYFKSILSIILNDLIKPALSMLAGLFICMFCLGEAWRGAKNYALDIGYTVILSVYATIAVMIIIAGNYIVIKIKSCLFDKSGSKG